MDWQSWIESLKPGDPVWHIDGRKSIVIEVQDTAIMVEHFEGCETWAIEDCTQPETTPFHVWAAAQGEVE